MAATSEAPRTLGRWTILRRNTTHRSDPRREARDPRTGERAWLELLPRCDSPGAAERLRRSARLLAAWTGPHVVPVLDAGEHEGSPYVLIQQMNGEALVDRLERRGALPLAEALDVAIPLCDALTDLHRRGVVHGDPTAADVILTARGGARLRCPRADAPRGWPCGPASDTRAAGALVFRMLAGVSSEDAADPACALREALARDPLLAGTAGLVLRECAVGVVLQATNPTARVEAATLARALRRLQADMAALGSCAPRHVQPLAPQTSRLAWTLLGLTTTGAIGLLALSLQLVARAGI